jgi:hypothetical protein
MKFGSVASETFIIPATLSRPQSGMEKNIPIKILSLLDCGLTGDVIAVAHPTVVQRLDLKVNKINRMNMTLGDEKSKIKITGRSTVKLQIGNHIEILKILIAPIAHHLILGLKWLQLHNPTVNWSSGSFTFNENCVLLNHCTQPVTIETNAKSCLGFEVLPLVQPKLEVALSPLAKDVIDTDVDLALSNPVQLVGKNFHSGSHESDDRDPLEFELALSTPALEEASSEVEDDGLELQDSQKTDALHLESGASLVDEGKAFYNFVDFLELRNLSALAQRSIVDVDLPTGDSTKGIVFRKIYCWLFLEKERLHKSFGKNREDESLLEEVYI